MRRRSLIRHAGIAGVLASSIAPAVHAQAAVRWRLASSFPKSLDTIYGGAEIFAKHIKTVSGGKFEVSVHAAGELVPAFGVVDAVQNGILEAVHTAPYYFFDKNETFAIGGAIPFGLNSRQMSAWTFHGNGLSLMREFYADYNIINFACGNTGAQMGGWFRKEIKSLSDMKGLKMRIQSSKVLDAQMRALGAILQVMAFSELYQGLQSGVVDGTEGVPQGEDRQEDERHGGRGVGPGDCSQ